MINIAGLIVPGGQTTWQCMGDDPMNQTPGISIQFTLDGIREPDVAINEVDAAIKRGNNPWIVRRGAGWDIDVSQVKGLFGSVEPQHLNGTHFAEPQVEHHTEDTFGEPGALTTVELIVT